MDSASPPFGITFFLTSHLYFLFFFCNSNNEQNRYRILVAAQKSMLTGYFFLLYKNYIDRNHCSAC